MTKTYTNTELALWLPTLESYRVHKTLTDGTKISYIDFDQYLIDQRILVRQHGYQTPAVVEARLGEYEEQCEKFAQLRKYLGRKAYAQQKEAEELAALQL